MTGFVTLSTQGTADFLHHVTTLCDRWRGPMSVAVYIFDQQEFAQAAEIIKRIRICNACSYEWVDWHLFYENSHDLMLVDISSTLQNCTPPNYKVALPPGWKREGSYPINVGRNIARNSTRTPYVLASDVELYPSESIRPRFEAMIRSRREAASRRQVFVLPVFEVYSKFKPPKTKEELRYMYKKKQAISFHKYRCNLCHQIPNVTSWMNSPPSEKGSKSVHLQPFHVWRTVKREPRFQLQSWEPFFIGTAREPEFDPRLSWEGKQNKMQLAYEMCLMGYDFHILDDAFLVHAPGVNIYNSTKDRFRERFVAQNQKVMKVIKKELQKKYGRKYKC